MRASLRDTIFDMSERAPRRRTRSTVFEALEDAGLTAAAVNITCYRGRTRHRDDAARRHAASAFGPKRFFFYNLFESDQTGAPLACAQPRRAARSTRTRPRSAAGSSRATASTSSSSTSRTTTSPRTRSGPTRRARRSRASTRALSGARRGGGRARRVPRPLRGRPLLRPRPDARRARRDAARSASAGVDGVVVTASNRAGMVYPRVPAGRAASSPRGSTASRVDLALFREGGGVVARREGEELRSSSLRRAIPQGRAPRARPPRSRTRTRARCSSRPAPGVEFADLGGRHHAGGGSHGSLVAGDSEVPDADGRPRARRRAASRTSRRSCSRTSASPAAYAERSPEPLTARGWSSGSSPRAGSRTSACSRRWGACRASCSFRRASARRAYARRRAPDRRRADDLAAVHGRADLRGARAARAASACSTSAPAPATRPRCSPSSRPRSSRSSGSRSSPSGRGARLAAAGYENVEVRVGDGTLGVPDRAPFDGDRRRGGRARAARGRCTSSSRPAAGSSSRSAAAARSSSRSSSRSPRARR